MKNYTFDEFGMAFASVVTWTTVAVAVLFTVTQLVASVVRGEWFTAFVFGVMAWMAAELGRTAWREHKGQED